MSEPRRFRVDDLDPGAAWPSFGVIGHPIDHSLSPVLHQAALEARGLDASFEAIDVAPESLQAFLGAAGPAGMRGLNVTAPHKQSVAQGCSRGSEEVASIGAANTLVWRDDAWVAHNTDARGFAMALQRSLGRTLPKVAAEVVVLGAGGAARAVVVSLLALGTRTIRVASRDRQRAQWAVDLGARWEAFPGVDPVPAGIVVNATPLGLRDGDPWPADPARVARCAFAMDLVYGREETAWVRAIRAAGGTAVDGRAMLIAQAALSFTLWFGSEAPLSEMAAAIGVDW